jgi:hypothetical protein
MKKVFFILLSISTITSCKKEEKANNETIETVKDSVVNTDSSVVENAFIKTKLKEISGFKYPNHDVRNAYSFNEMTLMIATDTTEIVNEKTKDYGIRLLVLDKKNKLLFKSRGMLDHYQMRPNFYASKDKKQVIISCELTFEEKDGAILFILENDKISEMGDIEIENSGEDSIAGLLKIDKVNSDLVISFLTDEILLTPDDNETIPNRGISYIYKNGKLERKGIHED